MSQTPSEDSIIIMESEDEHNQLLSDSLRTAREPCECLLQYSYLGSSTGRGNPPQVTGKGTSGYGCGYGHWVPATHPARYHTRHIKNGSFTHGTYIKTIQYQNNLISVTTNQTLTGFEKPTISPSTTMFCKRVTKLTEN